MIVIADEGRWRVILPAQAARLEGAIVNLEQTILRAIEQTGLERLTLTKTHRGWMASRNSEGAGSFTMTVNEHPSDPMRALTECIVGRYRDRFPEYIGHGPNGAVPDLRRFLEQTIERLIAALDRL